MARPSPANAVYSVHPGVRMMQDGVASLKEKTGRSLEEWIAHVKKSGPPTEQARRDRLKQNCELGTSSAWWIAERAEGKGGGRQGSPARRASFESL